MKKIIILFCVFSFSFSFSQTENQKKLIELHKKSIMFKKINTHIEDNLLISYVKFYECMVKNYKIKLSNESDFLNEKDFLKKYKDTTYQNVLDKSLHFRSHGGDYETRLFLQKKYNKCIKKEDIDY